MAASLLLSFQGSGAGWGRQWVRCQGRAQLLNARTTLGLNGQGPGCQRALQSASVGHGLIIFLEKLGFCQVPLLQIVPGAGGFPPTEVLSPALQLLRGALQKHRGHHL